MNSGDVFILDLGLKLFQVSKKQRENTNLGLLIFLNL